MSARARPPAFPQYDYKRQGQRTCARFVDRRRSVVLAFAPAPTAPSMRAHCAVIYIGVCVCVRARRSDCSECSRGARVLSKAANTANFWS